MGGKVRQRPRERLTAQPGASKTVERVVLARLLGEEKNAGRVPFGSSGTRADTPSVDGSVACTESCSVSIDATPRTAGAR
ncbi:hypothetical protein [Streptomyces sp. NPDC054887]